MDQITLFRSIVEDEFLSLNDVSDEATQIVNALLTKDPSLRLGGSGRGQQVLGHAWFNDIDKDAYRKREVAPYWKPKVDDPLDASMFDDWGDLVDKTTEAFDKIPDEEAEKFLNF